MKKIYNFKIVKKNEKIGLIPTDEETRCFLEKKFLKDVNIAFCESSERILKHHKKLFAIMKIFLDNFDVDMTIEELLIYLKIKVGYYKEIIIKGQKIIVPKSINFFEMSQQEFEIFYDLTVKIMANALGITRQELENNIEVF